MAQQLLDLGTSAGDGTGTPGRAGGEIINDNFTELYSMHPAEYTVEVNSGGDGIDITNTFTDSGSVTRWLSGSSSGVFTFENSGGSKVTLNPLVGGFDITNGLNAINYSIDGLPVFNINATAFRPENNNTINLGSSIKQFKVIYSSEGTVYRAGDGASVVDWHAAGSGLQRGTSATQKQSFWGATPVVQPSANADTSGATLGQLETEVNELKQLLRDIGLMAL